MFGAHTSPLSSSNTPNGVLELFINVLFFFDRTTSPPGEPLVRAPVGKPRCPPAISRLRVEKVEGGLAVAGVVVAANCQIVLPIFGFLFMLVGCVLTGKLIF